MRNQRGSSGRRDRRRSHSFLPRAYGLRPLLEPRHDDGRAARARRSLFARRRSAWATSRSAPSSSIRATSISRASRRCRRASRPRRRRSTSNAPAARACPRRSSSAARSRPGSSTPASRAARTRSATCRSSIPRPIARCCSRARAAARSARASRRGSSCGRSTSSRCFPSVIEPRTKLSMGESMEITAKEWHLSREEQDELALASHQNAARAYAEGFYDDLVVEFQGVKRDNNLRSDTSLEQLAKLKPVFDRGPGGTLTAGNSTPFTDGASAVLLSSEEWAKSRGLAVAAYLTHSREAAVDFVAKEGLADGARLRRVRDARRSEPRAAGLRLLRDPRSVRRADAGDAESLGVGASSAASGSAATARSGSIDRSKLNVKGGSVAVGHPFAATGTRIVATLAKLLQQTRARPRLDLRLHGRRHGRHGDPRSRLAPIPRCAAPSVVAGSRDRAGRRVAPCLLVVRHHLRRELGELLLPVRGARMRAQELRRPAS